VWGLLASGSLLAAVSPGSAAGALAALEQADIPAASIGTLTAEAGSLQLRQEDGATRAWPTFDRDEIARYFAEPG
jgi:hydrogenase maturation factor